MGQYSNYLQFTKTFKSNHKILIIIKLYEIPNKHIVLRFRYQNMKTKINLKINKYIAYYYLELL